VSQATATLRAMRFRLYPSTAQEVLLLEQCGHARCVWNLGLEQPLMWARWKGPTPGFNAQAAQLTEARAAAPWLAAGSQTVQQQGLRDLDQAWRQFFAGTHRRPRWRRAGEHEGLRIVGPQAVRVRRDNRARSSVLSVGEDRLGLVQSQPGTGRLEVVPHHRRAGGPLAYRVRCDPRTDPRTRGRRRCRGGPGCHARGGAVHR
jgi:transposase